MRSLLIPAQSDNGVQRLTVTDFHPYHPLKRALRRRALMLRLVAACAVLSQLPPARAEPSDDAAKPAKTEGKPKGPSVDDICRTLAKAAADNALPEELFTRLIWQESAFDPTAVSPAGAQGIAQFMPQTAAERGLPDPFEPLQALRESASYLRELRVTFGGNLGLAVAAYNAGPGQVEAWLARRRGLPGETQAYVRIVTGHSAEEWASRAPPQPKFSEPSDGKRCVELAKLMVESPHRRLALAYGPAWGPWGVQLAGTWSEGRVLASYERLRRRYSAILGDRLPLVLYGRRRATSRFLVRVSENSRAEADALCARLRAAGGACIVVRNWR
jgi:hypothetical protein